MDLHVSSCDDVTLSGVTIRNPLHGQNTDGIDRNMCNNVLVENCDISSGDDAIVLKCTEKKAARVSKNITVTGCRLETECQALKIGTETPDGFENITFRDCSIYNCSDNPAERASTEIAIETVDGGIVNGVFVSILTMSNVRAPIFIRQGNRGRGQEAGKAKPGALKKCPHREHYGTTFTNGIIDHRHPGTPGGGSDAAEYQHRTGRRRPQGMGRQLRPGGDQRLPGPTYVRHSPSVRRTLLPHVKSLTLQNVRFIKLATDGRPMMICDDVEGLVAEGLQEAPVIIKTSAENESAPPK